MSFYNFNGMGIRRFGIVVFDYFVSISTGPNFVQLSWGRAEPEAA